jgi:hypothetical protein
LNQDDIIEKIYQYKVPKHHKMMMVSANIGVFEMSFEPSVSYFERTIGPATIPVVYAYVVTLLRPKKHKMADFRAILKYKQ